MTPEQFCYWLQGYVEITENSGHPSKSEWAIIKDHLKLVFNKQTPDYEKIYETKNPYEISKTTC